MDLLFGHVLVYTLVVGDFIEPPNEIINRTLANIERDVSLMNLANLEDKIQAFLNQKGPDENFEEARLQVKKPRTHLNRG